MHCDLEQRSSADLEAASCHRALDVRPGRLQCKRLQEEDRLKHGRARRSTSELEIPGSREDDATLHDVIGHERVHRANKGRPEQHAFLRRGNPLLNERMRRLAPGERAPPESKMHNW